MAAFEEGNTASKGGLTGAGSRVRRSKLRPTLKKLLELTPKAVENVEAALKGEPVDKTVLETSKWAIRTTESLVKSVNSDEATQQEIKHKAFGSVDNVQQDVDNGEYEDDYSSYNRIDMNKIDPSMLN